ncbi:ATP-binding protein [Syntrophomonas palmitatica]|uniref:ATP-binding protein n=1 Tax=Syntrophomonas palmitatica TaxID=402877 RepID=UPI0006D1022B|nr:4Fe-4S binding protein [Syntrophomonas palmitatica]
MVQRTIIKIDKELCNGCGACISPCAEGALALVDGKAEVIKEELCDGAGFCLGVCPLGALSLETREAEDFSESAVKARQGQKILPYIPQHCTFCNNSEEEVYLLPLKHKGQALWTCTRCLPRLIHG